MKWIALIGPELEENLGIRYISSALRTAGFSTAIIPFNKGADLSIVVTTIKTAKESPFIVAISLSFQSRAMDCLALILALRENGYQGHITSGGHFGYFCRQELLSDFKELDSICCGESEEVIVDLAQAISSNQPYFFITGLCCRSTDGSIIDNPPRPAPEITTLPWPDRVGNRASCLGHNIAAIVGGRGCSVMKDSFGLYRLFLGVENDSSQGLTTLGRGVSQIQNHNAMDLLVNSNIYTCFNLLMFEPDATIESLRTNLNFIKHYGCNPFFFGRVELYAGTPLLKRMQSENIANGNYISWNYQLRDPSAQRAFEYYMRSFHNRNFSPDSPILSLMTLKHDIEIFRIFHPDIYNGEWPKRANHLCQNLADDTVAHMSTILDLASKDYNKNDVWQEISLISKEIQFTDTFIRSSTEKLVAEVHSLTNRNCCHERPLSLATINPPFEKGYFPGKRQQSFDALSTCERN